MIAMLDGVFKFKDALLRVHQGMYPELPMPNSVQLRSLEDLLAALRPVEVLTSRLCQANFNVIKADIAFNTTFTILQSQNNAVADSILEALKLRYDQRRNDQLLSCLKFLSNPVGYNPRGSDLEMPQLRVAIRNTYERLFPEVEQRQPEQNQESQVTIQSDSDSEEEEEEEDDPAEETRQPARKLNYGEQVSKMFDDALNSTAVANQRISKTIHMDEEIALAAKTGELTAKLKSLREALLSIPAASIECERAFSVASNFATKIRSKLSDQTLDRFCFAKSYFKNKKGLKKSSTRLQSKTKVKVLPIQIPDELTV